ncbi:MAG: hypothetical protein HYY04_08930, partial [Chloroflexi bacterium]|nr:hypothetical protein [Chloroflexota bacterium]
SGMTALIRPDGLIVPAVLVALAIWRALGEHPLPTSPPACRSSGRPSFARSPGARGDRGGDLTICPPFLMESVNGPTQERQVPRHEGSIGTLRGSWSGSGLLRRGSQVVLVFVLLVAPWLLFAGWYFGSPVPQSLLAKWDLPVGGQLASVRYFAAYFLDVSERGFLPLTSLALVGLLVKLRRNAAGRPLLAWSGAYTAAFLVTNKFIYPAWPFEWYFLPLLLPYSVATAAGAVSLVEWLVTTHRRLAHAYGPLLVGLGLVFIVVSRGQLSRQVAFLAIVTGGREALYPLVAERLTGYGVTGDVVAAWEIGALGYAYPGPILDLHGLVSPAVVGRRLDEVLQTDRPPWLVSFHTSIPPEVARSPWFQEHYRPVMTLENWETRRLVLLRWYPDPATTRNAGATLGDTFELVGRRLRWESATTAPFLRLELVWRARRIPTEQMTFVVRVLDQDGGLLARGGSDLQEGARPTTTWRAGELVVDQYDLRVPAVADRRPTWLAIGGHPVHRPGEPLRWYSASGLALESWLSVPLTTPSEAPAVACGAAFADGIHLAGLTVQRADSTSQATFWWEAYSAPVEDYTLFVDLLDGNGGLIARTGEPLGGWKVPSSTWEPGDRVAETRTLPLGPGQAALRAMIWLGAPSTGGRLVRTDAPSDHVEVAFGPPAHCT